MRKRSWTKRNILQIPTLTVATLAVLCGLLVATAGGSTPANAQSTDVVVWDAQMRVGDIGDHGLGDGSSSLGWGTPTVGSITPGTFSHMNVDYTVTHLYQKTTGTADAGNLQHTLNVDAGGELPSDLKLVVDGREFMISDASFHMRSHVYTWDTSDLGWAVGNSVDVQLKYTATFPAFWRAEMTVGVIERGERIRPPAGHGFTQSTRILVGRHEQLRHLALPIQKHFQWANNLLPGNDYRRTATRRTHTRCRRSRVTGPVN